MSGPGAAPGSSAGPAERSITRRIVQGASVVAAATVVVKAVGFAKEIVVAAAYGRGDAIEAFLIAVLLPNMAAAVTAGSFRQAFIPAYVRLRRASGPDDADRLGLHGMTAALAWLAGVAIVLFAAAPLVVGWIARGYDPDKAELAVRLLRALTPVCLLAGLPTMLSGVLEADERFAPAVLAQVGVPAATVAWVLAAGDRWGAWPLVGGTLTGLAVQATALAVALRRGGHRRPRWGVGAHPEFRTVVGQWLPAAGALVFQDLMFMVDQAMSAALAPGSVAALGYAYRIVSLPLTLATSSLALAILPVLSDLAGRDDRDGFWTTTSRWIRGTLWAGVPATVALIAAAVPVVRAIYQRGAFSAEDTGVVAGVLIAYAGMIPFYVAGIVAVQAVTAMARTRVLLWTGAVNLTVNVIGNVVLSRWFGVAGIALSTVLVYAVATTTLVAVLRVRRRRATAD